LHLKAYISLIDSRFKSSANHTASRRNPIAVAAFTEKLIRPQ
jgi:hypothetical protein